MARHRTHTLNPKHLAILQWLDQFSVTEERPEGWCKEERIQRGIRLDPQTMRLATKTDPRTGITAPDKSLPISAAGEELHDLTVQLNSRDDPFVIVHPNKHSYRISRLGRKLARRCRVEKRSTSMGDKFIVIETATGRPPVIQSIDNVPAADDGEDLEDADTPARAPEPEYEEPDEDGQDDDEADPGDEINDDPPSHRPTPRPAPARPAAPARPVARPVAIKPAKPARKPTRASVPARDE